MARMYSRSLRNRWKDLKMVLWKPWLRVEYEGIEVHYKHRLDGGGSTFGQDYIRFARERKLPRQGRVFEWCAGPGFIGFSLLAHGYAESLCVADINPHAVKAARRTIRANRLEDRVNAYVSDNLCSLPASERWDLVVGNPVHFADAYHGSIRAHDPGWRIHEEFYRRVGDFLAPQGVVLIQECCDGSSAETFKPMIEANGLQMVHDSGPLDFPGWETQFYFLASMRAGSAIPAWLR